MPRKVRKQIYIEEHQERLLKRLAKTRPVTEAEIIRQALDLHMRTLPFAGRRFEGWNAERAFILEWMKEGPVPGGRKWTRAELYER